MKPPEDFDGQIISNMIDEEVMKEYITNKKKLEEEPDNIKVNYYFAKYYYNSKRYEESLTLLNRIIDINSEIPNVYYYKALNYYEKGDFKKALNNSYKALEYESDFSKLDNTRTSFVYAYLFNIYANLDNIKKSLFYLNKYIESSGIEKSTFEDGKKRLSDLKIYKEEYISILQKTELPKISNYLNKLFRIPLCTKCNDNKFIVLKSNTAYNGIEIKCKGCNKKIWINTEMTIPKEYINLIKEWVELEKPFEITLSTNYKTIKKQSRLTIPSVIRQEVWRRDQGKCANCGSRENLEYDHIIPVSKGGSNTARNIELLCQKCNREKTNKIQ